MSESSGYRWIRSDGKETPLPDRQVFLAKLFSGEIQGGDLVRRPTDRVWVKASKVRKEVEAALDRELLTADAWGDKMTSQLPRSFPANESYVTESPTPPKLTQSPRHAPPEDRSPWQRRDAPWRRYFARFFDFSIAVLTIAIGMGLLIPELLYSELANTWIHIGTVLIGFPIIDAFFLSRWNTSPGKWLLAVRTVKGDGKKFSFLQALGRAFDLVMRGTWFGIPVLTMIPLAAAYRRASRGDRQPWDENLETHTEVKLIGLRFLLYLLFVAVLSLGFFGWILLRYM